MSSNTAKTQTLNKLISLSSVISSTFDCTGKKNNFFYKDPENAHYYFECVGGKAINFTCPEDLVFDDTKQVCDYRNDSSATTSAPLTTHTIAHTTAAPTTKPTTAAPTTKPTTAAPTTHPTTAAPTTKPTTAAPTTKPTTAAPTTKPTTAAPTTHPTTAAPTTKPTTAAPTKPTTAPPTNNPTTTAGLTTKPVTVTTQKPTTDAFSEVCKGKPDGLYKDPSNTHKYFQCSGSITFHQTCPDDLFFNDTKKSCDYSTTSDPKATTAAHTTAKP